MPAVSSFGEHWADLVALLDADHPRQLFVAECQCVCGGHGDLSALESVEVAMAFCLARLHLLNTMLLARGGADLVMIRAQRTLAEAVQLPTVLLLSLWATL